MLRPWTVALVAAILVSACEPSRQMRVRDSQHPDNVDKNVRFRTTYYFRTFDWCYGRGIIDGLPDVMILPETDSLYRFRMTGKAEGISSKVRFESGTLPASSIDPFDAKIDLDERSGSFRFVSATELANRSLRAQAREDYQQLIAMLAEIDATGLDKTEKSELKTKVADAMQDSINVMTGNELAGREEAPDDEGDEAGDFARAFAADRPRSGFAKALRSMPFAVDKVPTETGQEGGATPGSEAKTIESGCGKDAPVRRGFQIMGPEGWRTFNQDERLIMAMSIDEQPLISVLQQYSDRILSAKSDPTLDQLTLTQEHLRIMRAERAFDGATASEGGADTAFAQAVKEFENGGE